MNIDSIKQIARDAGKAVMDCIQKGLDVEWKLDQSPVTNADKESHRIISEALHRLDPNIPIMSEEDPGSYSLAASRQRFWCIDPVDSTRTMRRYAKGETDRDGFAINIGLAEDGKASQGVVYYPARDTMFFTGDDGGAYKQVGDLAPELLTVQGFAVTDDNLLRVAVSHKETSRPITIYGRKYIPVPEVGGGRALRVASGEADLAHLNGNFAYWDVLAGHAISKEAGAQVVDRDTGDEITYTNPHPAIPDAIAGHLDSIITLSKGFSLKF